MDDLFVDENNVENESLIFSVPEDHGSEGGDDLDPRQDSVIEQGESSGNAQMLEDSAQGQIYYEEDTQQLLPSEMVLLQGDQEVISPEEISQPEAVVLTDGNEGVLENQQQRILLLPVKSSSDEEQVEEVDYTEYYQEIIGKLETLIEIQADNNTCLSKVYGNCIAIMTITAAIFGLLAISILFSKVNI